MQEAIIKIAGISLVRRTAKYITLQIFGISKVISSLCAIF